MKIFFLRKVAGQVLVSFSFGSSSILRGRVLQTFGGIFLVRKIATLIFMEGLCFFSFFFQDFCFCYLFYVTESQTYIHLVMENVPSIYEGCALFNFRRCSFQNLQSFLFHKVVFLCSAM